MLFVSDQNSLHLIQAHLVAAPVIELGGAGAVVVGHRGAAADHGVRIGLGQGSAGELAGAAADGAEQRALRIPG